MHCYRVYTTLWLLYCPRVHNVLQRTAWGKKIPARYTARRSDDTGDVGVSRSIEGYSQDAGSENWEPGRRRLVRRPRGKPEGLVRNYGTCCWGHVRDVGLQKRGWAHDDTWIAGRGRDPDKNSSWRWNVRLWTWGRRRWATQERPMALQGQFCIIQKTTSQIKTVPSSHNRFDKPVTYLFSSKFLCRIWWNMILQLDLESSYTEGQKKRYTPYISHNFY